MSRRVTEYCGRCGAHWQQDWEDPPECPYCTGCENDEDDYHSDCDDEVSDDEFVDELSDDEELQYEDEEINHD